MHPDESLHTFFRQVLCLLSHLSSLLDFADLATDYLLVPLSGVRVMLSSDSLRLWDMRSLISIAVLSLLQNMCPEEAEILHQLESDSGTLNPHCSLVRQVNCN